LTPDARGMLMQTLPKSSLTIEISYGFINIPSEHATFADGASIARFGLEQLLKHASDDNSK
jgi:hypothetical protein